MGAQHFAQGGVQQVGCRVVEDGGATARTVHGTGQHVTQLDGALLQRADVAMELACELLRIGHRQLHASGRQHAGIADLAAGFGVERGLRGEHDHLVTGLHGVHRAAILDQRHDLLAFGLQGVIAQENRRRQGRHQLGRQGHAATELAGGTRGLALVLHRGLEAVHVHAHATLAGDVGGQVNRETIGVVQAERVHARDDTIADLGRDVVENLHAGVQRLGKTLFLRLQGAHHGVGLGRQFRVGMAHLLDQGRYQLAEERLANTQHPAVAQGAANDAAQDIAAAFVGRQHAVDDQERAGADVIGDHPQRLVLQIGHAGQLAGLADQRLEQVDLIVGVHVLQDRRQALQAHAGIHARRRQRLQRAIGLAVELHEHQVPDFDETVTVLIRRARGATGDMVTMVEEDLGAGTAGAGIGHLPEVVRGIGRALVVTDAHDALFRDADHVAPQREGLVVGVVHGDQQALGRQLPDLGQQFPGPGNGVLLEVIAKGPVAQHFKERVVTGGIAHRVQVVVLAACTQAALDVGSAHVAALFRTQEHILELDHAGIGEQQGRVVARHQRRRRHDGVALALEEFKEVAADLGSCEFDRCIHGDWQ